ncbi:hypothetical protein [Microbacterium lacticum]
MSTAPSLLIDLAGVARLAGVQRPVASMWRSRFAAAPDPFPEPIADEGDRPRFDAEQIADWLARTGHGNNPEARADAAAAATPPDFSFSDASAVAELQALITLQAQIDALDDLSHSEIEKAAADTDAHDQSLRREITAHVARGAPWLTFATGLVDAAYSPVCGVETCQPPPRSIESGGGIRGVTRRRGGRPGCRHDARSCRQQSHRDAGCQRHRVVLGDRNRTR